MDEKQLIAGSLEGRMEDFRRIVDRHSAAMMALAMNILGNRDDAEDALQDAFIQVYRNLEAFDMAKSFKTRIFTILYRRCLDYLRRRRRSFELLRKMEREAPQLQPANPSSFARPSKLPAPFLQRLNPKERTALCLWANEGYTSREISEVLRCSASTARVHLFQARKKIKKFLEQDHVYLQNS
ncbi:MAG: RNA polymerase sigma factor [Acidobacteriota bacterium]